MGLLDFVNYAKLDEQEESLKRIEAKLDFIAKQLSNVKEFK